MDTLSYIDIGILVLLILLSIKGIWQGIIRGLASFLGILLGIFFASRFYTDVGEWFAHTIYDFNSTDLNALVGFVILITLIWSVFLLVGEIIFRVLHFTPLAVLDRAFGLAFGFCKAFLLLSIVVFGISQIGWLKNFSQNIEQNSSIFPLMKNLAVHIMNLDEVQEVAKNLQSPQKNIEATINEQIDKVKEPIENVKNEAKNITQEIKEGAQNLQEQINSH